MAVKDKRRAARLLALLLGPSTNAALSVFRKAAALNAQLGPAQSITFSRGANVQRQHDKPAPAGCDTFFSDDPDRILKTAPPALAKHFLLLEASRFGEFPSGRGGVSESLIGLPEQKAPRRLLR